VRDLGLRLVSLALATVLWSAIAAEKTSEVGVAAPIELQNVPRDLELTGDLVSTVEVRIRASPGVVQRLNPGDIAVQVDLSGVSEGERIVHLTEQSLRAPFGVRLLKITPSILTLHFERTLQKVVPVRPRVSGTPARGYEVAELLSSPGEVRIAGPKSRIQQVESAFTEPVALDGAQADVSETVAVGLPDPALRILDRTRVRVTAKLREGQSQRSFSGLTVLPRGGAATLRPDNVEVILTGPASLLARVQSADVHPFVEVSRLSSARKLSVAVELSGLPGVSARSEPAEVLAIPSKVTP
jgi:YbbR domain-containing protein